MNEIIGLNELKTDLWQDAFTHDKAPDFDYDSDSDVMYLYFSNFEKKDRIITHAIDKHVSFLFRHSDNEIVGMSFEAFQKSFMPSYQGKSWSLKDTGIRFSNIRDVRFSFIQKAAPSHSKLSLVRKPIADKISLEPVFA